MFHKTRGIALNYMRYRETSIIVKIFTETFGLQSYLVKGVRTKKPTFTIALFQPLTLLDMVAYHKKQTALQYIAEVKCHHPLDSILRDIKKATITVFLAEFLTKTIREEEKNTSLFEFLFQAVIALNDQTTGYDFFHLTFILKLCRYLGFGINTAEEMSHQLQQLPGDCGFSRYEKKILNKLLKPHDNHTITLNKITGRKLMKGIIKFYQLHIDTLGELKSLKILQVIAE